MSGEREKPAFAVLKRNAMRRDAIQFMIPALIAFVLGLRLSAADGYDGLVRTIWNVIREPSLLGSMPPVRIVALALCVVGFAICFTAAATLRMSYSSSLVIREDHRLVTHGIYRLVRHPIYLGALIVLFAVPLYALSLPGFIVIGTLVPLILNRIRIEEGLLEEEFGEEYRAYRGVTKKLIPYVL